MLHRSVQQTRGPRPKPNIKPPPPQSNPPDRAATAAADAEEQRGEAPPQPQPQPRRLWGMRWMMRQEEEEPEEEEMSEAEPEILEGEGGEVEEDGEECLEGGEDVYGEEGLSCGGGEGEGESKSGKDRRKQREFEVFVGGLDRDTTESDLVKVFRDVGEVLDVRLVRRPYAQKGFAFVRFAEVEQAKRAAGLRFVEVRGNSCGVTRSNSNETLFLGNICTSWTKDDLVKQLKAFELENLEEVNLIVDSYGNGKNRGYAFLDFKTHMDAVAACCKLQQKDIFFGTDVRAEISFSRSIRPVEEIMAQVKSVFVDGIPTSWDESHVQRHFRKFGEIANVQLARNMPTAKRDDFCFVSFKTREDALHCIDIINTEGVGDGTEKLSLKATLKRPERRLPLNFGRRDYSGRNPALKGYKYHGIGHSYSTNPARTHEFASRERNIGTSGPNTFSSRHGHYRTILSPTMDASEEQSRRKYVQRVPENFESRPMRRYVREVPEKYEIQSSREYVREVFDRYESRSRREYVRELPEEYEGHSRRFYMREVPEEYENRSRRVCVREIPEEYENHPRRIYVRGIPEEYESRPRKEYVIDVPEKFESQSRNFLMEAPAVAHSRSRDQFLESCSSSRHALGTYQDSLAPYSQSRGPYPNDDDFYVTREQYENRVVDTFGRSSFAGVKRRYSDIKFEKDDDLLGSNSLMRHHGKLVEVDGCPRRGVSEYVDLPRSLSDKFDYEKECTSRRYGSRYLSTSGASTSYN